jgi:Ca-activated chloride channel family protein
MNTLIQRLVNACRSNRAGLLLFAGLSLATVLLLSLPRGAFSLAAAKSVPTEAGPVQIAVKPSQTKFVQGGNNTLYLDVVIKTPSSEKQIAAQRATDMVIVLDRSGSMAGPEKMPYAKAAIQDALSRLTEHDRFALVSFSDNAVVDSPLLPVDPARRENLNAIVGNIIASGGTNMGDGLNSALALMSGNSSERARKVLLLSDGQANQGITQPEALAQLATQLTRYGAVLSTIGMGLDFNETVMTQLADHGMGHYAFLENLAGLSQILSDDLNATRSIFASSSTLEIALGDGVKLLDAGGYPVTQTDPASVGIASGQLLAGADKHFVVTLSIPAEHTGAFALGKMHLNYQQQGRDYRTPVNANLQLTVVEPEKRREAVSSIDKDVYQQSWLKNNLGLMQKKLGEWVREGKKDQAEQAINEYRQAVQAAEAESNIPLASPAMAGKLDDMKAKVEEAFVGGRDDQAQKQKRAAKTMQHDAIKEQRAN